MEDIRWIQRFSNYCKALNKLETAVEMLRDSSGTNEATVELLREGLIQRFEYTHELAWNMMKDYAVYQGFQDVRGSRDAIRKALEMGLVTSKQWMESINDRNETSRNYDEEESANIYRSIVNDYFPLFCDFRDKMDEIKSYEVRA